VSGGLGRRFRRRRSADPERRGLAAPETALAVRAGADFASQGLLERGLRRATEAELVAGNAAELLVDGTAAYPAMLELIRSAERRIHLENYIVRDDAVGRAFAEALVERSHAGVEVRLLYDALGSLGTPSAYWNLLKEAGCEVRPWGTLLRKPWALLRREHRKLLLVDGRAAVVGGLCIGCEWSAADGRQECWRDTAVRLEGPVAREIDRSFLEMWRRAGGSAPEPLLLPLAADAGSVAARVVDGTPLRTRAYRLYQLIALLAGRSLYITMAYPLLPLSLRRALATAARMGVDVRLLVPDRSDIPLVTEAARADYEPLLRAGVRIYEWRGAMLHAKTLVADGSLTLIGSTNLTPFSLVGNYELDIEIQDRDFGGRADAQFFLDLENASEITLAAWRQRATLRRWRERLGAATLWVPTRLLSQ
jgi:cardiolipin synthase A/B